MDEQPIQLIPIGEVTRQTGHGRSTIYALVSQGKFPRPVAIGPQARRFVQHEVSAYIASKIDERDKATSPRKRQVRS